MMSSGNVAARAARERKSSLAGVGSKEGAVKESVRSEISRLAMGMSKDVSGVGGIIGGVGGIIGGGGGGGGGGDTGRGGGSGGRKVVGGRYMLV